jgi:hypothetical protein
MSLKLDIFYIFELRAEAPQTGIQAEYTPLEILLLLPILVGAGVASAGGAGAASTAGRRG